MELSTELRSKIVALVKSGFTQTAVALQLNTTRQNVSRPMQRYQATNSFKSRPVAVTQVPPLQLQIVLSDEKLLQIHLYHPAACRTIFQEYRPVLFADV